MPYSLTWEARGVYRRYHGDVTIAERRLSFDDICGDPRFDRLRYAITDYREAERYELSDEATREIAALHVAPAITNPQMRIAAVALRPDIVAAIHQFIALGFTPQPYRVFATLEEARCWVDMPWTSSGAGAMHRIRR